MNAIVGEWGSVFDTTIIGIHQVMLEDGRILYWGGDGNGNAFSNTQKYGIFDPQSGEHEILSAGHVVRMFCAAGVILPGTDKVLIAGGNGSGAAGGQLFDTSEENLTRDNADDMATGRFYPTILSLSSGQAVVLGGDGDENLRGTPEIFTLGEGWRSLDGAADADVAANWWYPRAWLNDQGEIVYFAINAGSQNANPGEAGSFEVMALDPSGNGSIRKIGELPFQMDATSPSAMYEPGKIVIMDHKGDLWIMDINGDEPQYTFAANLGGDRNNSDMTVLADGRVLINGGTKVGNSQELANALLESVMFDPFTGEVTVVDSEDVMRLYHSSSILLRDGTILSMGGGGLNNTVDMMDAQIYRPDYLFNEDGSLAERPEITSAPDSTLPGDTMTITVDDSGPIARMSFVKTGAVTHSLNMESGRMDLDFEVVSTTEIKVTLPDNPHVVGAGNWMLFAIDDQGVPSVAPIISVEPTLPLYQEAVAPNSPVEGLISVNYFDVEASQLSDVDFDATPIFEEEVTSIQQNVGTGAFYDGGRTDNFAAEYSGTFAVEKSGEYTFYLTSDDGSSLAINDQQIILNDGRHEATEKSATIYLEAGIHTLNARYFEYQGLAVMDLDWRGPDFLRAPFEVSGTAPEEPSTPTIVGTPGNDLLDGTDGDDVVDMGDGRDVWLSSAGNDRVDGGDPGYNQIDYNGAPEDYTFTANADGTVSVIKPNGVDIISNIGGFWFNGAGVWKPLEELVLPNPDAGPIQIDGTPDDDFLSGTLGDDLINMGAGRDVVNGSAGNDRIEGGDPGYNQIDYDGSPEDYSFTQNDDGTVTVVKPNGTDIISNIGGFWFKGPGVWKSLEDVLDAPPPGDGGDGGGEGGGNDGDGGDGGNGGDGNDGEGPITGTPEDDYLDGTDGDDIILAGDGVDTIFASAGNDSIDGQGGGYNQVNYNGKRADFVFTAQSDGSISAVSAEFGNDLLLNIGGIWFEEDAEWYPIEDLL